MIIEQQWWKKDAGWQLQGSANLQGKASLVLAFGSRHALQAPQRYEELKKKYPQAHILTASTSGEIHGTHVVDDTIVATAIQFERTEVLISSVMIDHMSNSHKMGQLLSKKFDHPNLKHLLVISDGTRVNGSKLVKGLQTHIPRQVPITGGLAGDADRFETSLVGINEPPTAGQIVAIGLYSQHLKVGHGSVGGWDPFGPQRTVTRSEHNKLYELDGQSALHLYKQYLGDQAAGLPGTALLFPLSIQVENEPPVVRTILGVNEQENSMTFAGDIPQNAKAQLMKANFDRLIDGAMQAAEFSLEPLEAQKPELVLCISCVGRKLVLGPRVEDEVEGVRDVLGQEAVIAGFYSYGEISPLRSADTCALHNQTMTITTWRE